MDETDELVEFMDELPTIQCGEGGCRSCSAAFHWTCRPKPNTVETKVAAEAWDEKTEPQVRLDVLGFDDDYVDLGGEGG